MKNEKTHPQEFVEWAQDFGGYTDGFMILFPDLLTIVLSVLGTGAVVTTIFIRIGRIVFPDLFKGKWDELLEKELAEIQKEIPDIALTFDQLKKPGGLAKAVCSDPSSLRRNPMSSGALLPDSRETRNPSEESLSQEGHSER